MMAPKGLTPDEKVAWCRAHAGMKVRSAEDGLGLAGRLVAVYINLKNTSSFGGKYSRGRPLIEGPRGAILAADAWKPDMERLVDDARGGSSCDFESLELIENIASVAAKASVPADNRYPHICPRCSAPAYVGLTVVDCSQRCILKPKGSY